jgi:hypothetical protein
VAAVVVIRGFHWAFHSRSEKALAIFVTVANRHRVKSRADIVAASARACGVRIAATAALIVKRERTTPSSW